MKLTPLEIRQMQFPAAFRGLNREDVQNFLQLASEEMEELARENNALKERLADFEKRLDEHREREKSLKDTLLAAQKAAEDMKAVAEREARITLSKAELDGEKLVREAVKRREKLVGDIHDLRRQRVQFETTLRNAVEVHLKMLDALKEHEEKLQTDDNLTVLRRAEKSRTETTETARRKTGE